MRILFVTPYPISRIRIRSYGFVTHLIQQHQLTLLTLCSNRREAEDVMAARRLGINVIVIQDHLLVQLLRCALSWRTSLPLQVVFAASTALRQALQKLILSGRFDVIHLEAVRVLGNLPSPFAGPLVWDAVDCISRLYTLGAQARATWLLRVLGSREARLLRQFETASLHNFRHVLVTSEREREAFLSETRIERCENLAFLHVISHGVDFDYFRPFQQEREPDLLLFSGKMSFHANIAAVCYLIKQILPLIWRQRPSVRLLVAGANPPRSLLRLASDHRITFTGYASDLRPYLARAQIAICPLPYAVGIQNKALEAMALATPLVVSPAVAAGFVDAASQALLVAHDAAEFAASVLRLLDDAALRELLAQNGLSFVRTHHNWDTIIQKLTAVYQLARVV